MVWTWLTMRGRNSFDEVACGASRILDVGLRIVLLRRGGGSKEGSVLFVSSASTLSLVIGGSSRVAWVVWGTHGHSITGSLFCPVSWGGITGDCL